MFHRLNAVSKAASSLNDMALLQAGCDVNRIQYHLLLNTTLNNWHECGTVVFLTIYVVANVTSSNYSVKTGHLFAYTSHRVSVQL